MKLASFGITAPILAICASLAILISLPGFAGYFFAPEGYVYTGFDWQDDFHLYASYIKQSAESPKIFMENRFTTEPQGGVYVFLYFSALGLVSHLTGLSVPMAFNLGRIAVAFLFLLALWAVLKEFFADQRQRTVAFLVCAVGGGIGWLFSLGSVLVPKFAQLSSTDLNYSLGYSTFGQLAFPLPYLAYSIFLIVFVLLKKYFETRDARFLAAALPAYALIFFVHPASIAVFSLCLLLIPAIPIMESIDFRKGIRYLKPMALFIIPAALIIIYLKFASADFAYSKSLEAYMNWKRAEPLFYFPIGYGALIPLAFFGLRRIQEINGFVKDFFYAWLLGTFIAAINPDKGVKLMFSLHIPLAIAASFGIFYLAEKISAKKAEIHFMKIKIPDAKPIFIAASVLIICLSAPFVMVERISDSTNPGFQSGPYLSKGDYEAIAFLSAQEKGNVLSSYKIGNNMAYLTHHISYLGHWTETVDVARKKQEVLEFFSGSASPGKKAEILRAGKIKYVFYGENERLLGAIDPDLELKEIYNSNGTSVYKAD